MKEKEKPSNTKSIEEQKIDEIKEKIGYYNQEVIYPPIYYKWQRILRKYK